jgi:hypothetical protein
VAVPLEELRQIAVRVADELRATADGQVLAPEVRARFLTLRAALFQRGIYDPVLVRFDSATVPRATLTEIAEQLATVAESLAG